MPAELPFRILCLQVAILQQHVLHSTPVLRVTTSRSSWFISLEGLILHWRAADYCHEMVQEDQHSKLQLIQ